MDGESRTLAPTADPVATATILVVDDNDLNRELLVQRLEYAGHQVVQAANGLEALGVLRSTPVDLVLLDIMMPVMDGHQALKEPDVVQAFLNSEQEFIRVRNQFHDPGEDQQAV
ncbi:MAG: response regulator [Thiogranum sp.]|nr:response regulator [Thiogranum sp.]